MVSVEPVMRFTDDFPVELIDVHPKFVAIGYDNYGNSLPEPRLETAEALCRILEDAKIRVHRKTIREPKGLLEPTFLERLIKWKTVGAL